MRDIRGDLSQSEFSGKIGVKQTTYSSWERNVKEPSYEIVGRIVRQFGVSADWLLGFSDDRAGRISAASDSQAAQKVAELEKENALLRAENAGLKYALDALGKGVTASVRPTARATGA